MSMNGPSPYAIGVIRALLARPMRIPQIVQTTGLHERTVRAQISALWRSGAVRVVKREQVRWGGAWAVYSPVVIEI